VNRKVRRLNIEGRQFLIDTKTSDISKEEVHLALIQTSLAIMVFAEHRKNMMDVLKKLEAKYNKDFKSSRNLGGFGLLIFALAAAPFTAGLSLPWLGAAAAGGCSLGGLVIGIDQGFKLSGACKKESAVGQLDKTIDNLLDALQDAKVGLASVYCCYILQMPLESMGTRERLEILKKLGIDMKELSKDNIYEQELIKLRMGRFIEAHKAFKDEREAVLRDAGLKELVKYKAI
jgi:hypothetical protein